MIGKIVAFVVGIFLVLIIIFMLTSDENSSLKEENSQVKTSPKISFNEKQDDNESKLIASLKQSLDAQNSTASKLYLKTCAPCHAKDGSGLIAPSIKGKSELEILARLKEYKENKISNTLMKGLLDNVSEQDLNTLASEISKFK